MLIRSSLVQGQRYTYSTVYDQSVSGKIAVLDGVISDDIHHTEVLKVSSIQYILCCIELPVACTIALMYRHDISAKCRLD